MESKHLFPQGGFSWSMRMRIESTQAYFDRWDPSGELLAEKRRLLTESPERYLLSTPAGDRLVDECWQLAKEWGHLQEPDAKPNLYQLALDWEVDIILMDKETTELCGGCVCFPSSWSLVESIGVPLWEIHERVPGLNPAIGEKMRVFLDSMPLKKAFFRENWGLTRSADLNYHPDLNRMPIDATVDEDQLFLRIEHQAFVSLTSGHLLAVRIEPIPFTELVGHDVDMAQRLLTQLQTMPMEVVEYKNLHRGINRAIEILARMLD